MVHRPTGPFGTYTSIHTWLLIIGYRFVFGNYDLFQVTFVSQQAHRVNGVYIDGPVAVNLSTHVHLNANSVDMQ